MKLRSKSTLVAFVSAVLAVALVQPVVAAPVEIPKGLGWVRTASDPAAALDAIASNPAKLPAEFVQRLEYVLDDDTLQVMVALSGRNAAIEDFIKANTTWLAWYGDAPRFLGHVTADQLPALLASDIVTFVEPDYIVTNFMAESTVDIRARSLANDGSAVWSFNRQGGPMGSLVSDVQGLSADQVTGKGVVVAITDSGIDKTHKDFGGWDCQPAPYEPCDSRIVADVMTDHLISGVPDPGQFAPTSEVASGHGTHVAGTIAGNGHYTRKGGPDPVRYGGDGFVFGVAPQASLIMTKNGDTLWAGLSTFGLQWQLDHAEELGIEVSSNSWGCVGGCEFSPNSATSQTFKDLYEAGVVTVFAAGNDGGGPDGAALSGNAQSPYVLGVAAYNDSDGAANDPNDDNKLADFSSRGKGDEILLDPTTWTPEAEIAQDADGERRPDIAAPGVGIWSARTLTGGAASLVPRAWTGDATNESNRSGFVPYAIMDGTSMATPHVAGAAAILRGACADETSLDAMRSIMAGANSNKVRKTDGSAVAEAFEVGYGGLDVRASLDWLRQFDFCGGTLPRPGSGGDPDPDPDPTPDPTAGWSDYYLHSESNLGNVDGSGGSSSLDETAPTKTADSYFFDVGPFSNSAADEPFDPFWTGEVNVGEPITRLKVDFWQKTPLAEPIDLVDWDVSLWVGDTQYKLPTVHEDSSVITDAPVRVQETITEMLDAEGNRVPLNIPDPDGQVTLNIAGHWGDAHAVATIIYDSTQHPSGFSVCCSVDPTDPAEAVGTTTEFTEGSATSGQYSDSATIAARLLDEDENAIPDSELTFELAGADGSQTWTAITDENGVASQNVDLDRIPDSYTLTARYAGETDVYEASDALVDFLIGKEDSRTVLTITGTGANRAFSAKVTEVDGGTGLAGVVVEFFQNGNSVGTATTNANGVATLASPPKHNKKDVYEAVFGSNAYYLRSAG